MFVLIYTYKLKPHFHNMIPPYFYYVKILNILKYIFHFFKWKYWLWSIKLISGSTKWVTDCNSVIFISSSSPNSRTYFKMTSLVTVTLWWWWWGGVLFSPTLEHSCEVSKERSLKFSVCENSILYQAATGLSNFCLSVAGTVVFTGELWRTQEPIMRQLSPSKSKEPFYLH